MAGRKPKSSPMTKTEMIESGQKQKKVSRVYKAESDAIKDEAISKSVSDALATLRKTDSRNQISLSDYPMVRAACEAYLEACILSSCFPSMSALAMALGYTRRNLYYFIEKNPDTESGKLLTQLHDMFANILTENSLRNNANNITAIFILKSMFGYKETQTFELVQGAYEQNPTMDDLIVRAGLLEDN